MIHKIRSLFNYADSQSLEFFVGLYLMAAAVHRLILLQHVFLGTLSMPFTSALLAAGLFQALAASNGGPRTRHWACASSLFCVLFIGFTYEGIMVGAASLWAWYRTLLDQKLESAS